LSSVSNLLLTFSVSSQHFHRINSYYERRLSLYAELESDASSAIW
jgi:hypothetical protein